MLHTRWRRRRIECRGVMIPATDSDPESDFQPFLEPDPFTGIGSTPGIGSKM